LVLFDKILNLLFSSKSWTLSSKRILNFFQKNPDYFLNITLFPPRFPASLRFLGAFMTIFQKFPSRPCNLPPGVL